MRLGVYPCVLEPGTHAAEAYGREIVLERHRHRFEFNNKYRRHLEKEGFVVSGHSPDGRLVEIIELRDHPWFVASQFHPELKSRPNHPHPLFTGFMRAVASTLIAGDQHPLPLELEQASGQLSVVESK
jgi:CTP synthase